MYKHVAFAVAAVLAAAGSCQAQTWEQFIDNGAVYTTNLAPGHGLSLDGAGGIFVQTLDTHPVSGTDFSHLYAFAGDGSHAYPWSLVGRPWGASDPAFVSRAFHSNAGYRVAWYEVGALNPFDYIVLFDPQSPAPVQQLTLPRQNGIAVLGVASDGQGGLLVLRSGNSGTLPTLLRVSYLFGSGQVLWEQPVADCNPGTVAVQPDDIDFAFDAQNPAASAIHVLGHCTPGIAGLSNEFLQSFDLDGGLRQQRRFNLSVANFPLLARHKVGGGAWLYEYAPETGGDSHLLQIADAQHGLYPLFWPDIHGAVAVDQGQPALIRAASAASPAHYFVADLQRSPGGLFEIGDTRLYKGLSAYAANGMRWSSDGQGNRVAAYRSSLAGSLNLAGYGQDTEPKWLRSLDAVGAAAQPQLGHEAASGEFVLAVDRSQNGHAGVYVTQFAALDRGACLPPVACPGGPDLP